MKILQNSAIIFMLAILFGIIIPELADITINYVIVSLMIVMTLSIKDLDIKNINIMDKNILYNLILNYLVLSSLILFLTLIFIDNIYLRFGFFVMASAPPAIAVVPFTRLLDGDVKEALISNSVIYLISIVLFPTMLLALTGKAVNVNKLIEATILLILLPILLSRLAKRVNIRETKTITNIGLALVIYSVVGINNKILFNLHLITGTILVGISRTFIVGFITFFVFLKIVKINFNSVVVKTLFASYKNLGLTAGVSYMLFGEMSVIPSVICILFEIIFFNCLYLAKNTMIAKTKANI